MNLKDKYIHFFEKRGHKHIPSAPLVPENDPTVLFNTAGMQPLVPYLMGQPHPLGKRLVDYQKCFRTNDLDEVGDTTHHTFFEMLGNWSLGDYFKEQSIKWSFEFLTKELNIPIDRLAVTIFKGNEVVQMDNDSKKIWLSLGMKEEKIYALGTDDNWWPNIDMMGPCGPDSEIFYFRSTEPVPQVFDPNDKRWVEIWNNVFMQYNHTVNGFEPLKSKNVDTGMGVERVVAILEGVDDNYKSSIWKNIINQIEQISKSVYQNNEKPMRIIADHIRAIVMLISDGVLPSNTDQGYVLRRLIRRTIRYAKKLNININSDFLQQLALIIIKDYKKYYPNLETQQNHILKTIQQEQNNFTKTLEKGLREFNKLVDTKKMQINKDIAFKLYDTYGFPIEETIELAKENNMKVDVEGFYVKFKEHQERSRINSAHKFKGGLEDNSEMSTKYHTATHLLNAALKIVLKDNNIHQKGSNITPQRMRFDFNYSRKLTDKEKEEIEQLVNNYINQNLKVEKQEMSKKEAINTGAECMFIEKYPDKVTIYNIGNVSKELCGGPHVNNTGTLGHFQIIKEESSSSGIRRIKAVLK